MSTKKNVLLGAIATIAVCLSIIIGATFAMFTTNDQVDVTIKTGTVKVTSSVDYLSLYSVKANADGSYSDIAYGSAKQGKSQSFMNTGTATLNGKHIVLDRITAGDKVVFTININNGSDVNAKYRTFVKCEEGTDLFTELNVKIGEDTYLGKTAYTTWADINPGAEIDGVKVEIALPADANIQGKGCKIVYGVEAVQGNAYVQNAEADTLEVYTPADLLYLGKAVAARNTFDNASTIADGTLEKGVTKVVLKNDIDFAGETLKPVGYVDHTGSATANGTFNGEFDGNGFAIKNAVINVSDVTDYSDDNQKVYGVGLFTRLGTKANVHDVKFDGVTVGGDDYNVYSVAGIVSGYAAAGSVIDNVKVSDSTVYAATKNGAIVGMLEGAGEHTVTNCTLENVTVNGNYTFGLVAGFVNGSVDFTGTTADANSHTVFVEFDGSEFKSTDSRLTIDEGYVFNYIAEWGARLWLTDPQDAFAVKRSANWSGNRNVYALGATDPLAFFDEVIYVNATDTIDLSAEKDSEGNIVGTRVYDESGLRTLSSAINAGGGTLNSKNISIEKDIVLTSNFTSIGTADVSYSGVVDGKNHTITGFKQGGFNSYGGGLFYALKNATVKNLTVLVNSFSKRGTNIMGVIAGYGYGNVTFENVTVASATEAPATMLGYGKVGGLLGMTSGNCAVVIKDCAVENLNIKGYYNVGGYIGLVSAQTKVNIENSTMTATLKKADESHCADYTFELDGKTVTGNMYQDSTTNLELDSSVATLYSRLISPEPAATKVSDGATGYTVQSYAVNE